MGQRPIQAGVFTWPSDQPQLIGGRSRSSGVTVFPFQATCPKTAAADMEQVLLPTRGTLWSWTIQGFPPKSPPYRGPAEFTPYGVGYVELTEDAPGAGSGATVIVESRLTVADPDQLEIGMAMEMVVVPFVTDADGTELLTYAFAPAKEES